MYHFTDSAHKNLDIREQGAIVTDREDKKLKQEKGDSEKNSPEEKDLLADLAEDARTLSTDEAQGLISDEALAALNKALLGAFAAREAASAMDDALFSPVLSFSGKIGSASLSRASYERVARAINTCLSKEKSPFFAATVSPIAWPLFLGAMESRGDNGKVLDISALPEHAPQQMLVTARFFDNGRVPKLRAWDMTPAGLREACKEMGLTCSLFSADTGKTIISEGLSQSKRLKVCRRSTLALVLITAVTAVAAAICGSFAAVIPAIVTCLTYRPTVLGNIFAPVEGSSMLVVADLQEEVASADAEGMLPANWLATVTRRRNGHARLLPYWGWALLAILSIALNSIIVACAAFGIPVSQDILISQSEPESIWDRRSAALIGIATLPALAKRACSAVRTRMLHLYTFTK